jgi:hypothetical protein
MHRALTALAVCVLAGALGAWAFNPEDGMVLHSEPLWRIFGIAFEVGLLVLVAAGIGMAASTLICRTCDCLRSH